MKFLIAPNAFKGTLTAQDAALEIQNAIKSHFPNAEFELQPIADGGDGTCTLLSESLNLETIQVAALNPIGQPVMGFFGFDRDGKKAYLDVSTASGIGHLNPTQLSPNLASTYGTGLILSKAIEIGASEIVLGLGGSATVDLGIGILLGLGILFLDEKGREITPFSPDYLSKIKHIQLPPRLPQIRFTLLCDVRNPLLGEMGAVHVFGPQKGVKAQELDSFEREIAAMVEMMGSKTRKPWVDQEGFGAAGGIAAGLSFFFPVQIQFGAEYFLALMKMKEKIKSADWVITGEGRYDRQSEKGKACFELLQLSKLLGKKTALITSGGEGADAGFDRIFKLPDLDFQSAEYKEKARENLRGLDFSGLK